MTTGSAKCSLGAEAKGGETMVWALLACLIVAGILCASPRVSAQSVRHKVVWSLDSVLLSAEQLSYKSSNEYESKSATLVSLLGSGLGLSLAYGLSDDALLGGQALVQY